MALYDEETFEGVVGEILKPTDLCFYCRERLGSRGVYWHGTEAEIWLHQGCAVRLGVHLHNDAAQLRFKHPDACQK